MMCMSIFLSVLSLGVHFSNIGLQVSLGDHMSICVSVIDKKV
jgi:hypothetical protein